MAIAQRKPVLETTREGAEARRAKSLRPFERSGASSLRGETLEALQAFERAAASFPSADLRLRVAASRAMDELRIEWERGHLPDDLAHEIERWDEGEFAGTRVDIELANFALAELLGSDTRVDSEDADLEN